jgi:hypothetical protein
VPDTPPAGKPLGIMMALSLSESGCRRRRGRGPRPGPMGAFRSAAGQWPSTRGVFRLPVALMTRAQQVEEMYLRVSSTSTCSLGPKAR